LAGIVLSPHAGARHRRIMTKSDCMLASALMLLGCGGSGTSSSPPDLAPAAADAGAIEGQHGQVIDYFNLTPLAGFTVSDGTNSTTTDAQGRWVLPLAVGDASAPVVTGPSSSRLQRAKVEAAASDVDVGQIPMPSAAGFMSELSILGADQSKALVQVVIIPTGACTSLAGGTLTLESPASAARSYFSPCGFPLATQIYDTMDNRPVAVVYNLDPSATEIELTLHHPTCKLSAAGAARGGAKFEGLGTLSPSEPGDNNATLVLLAE
jgi:hypothetical protein